uniref:Uncharacterized protein n=1 Tax=Oryza nivara TaxID=4536 RepID=A0A0E0I355_ORYNI
MGSQLVCRRGLPKGDYGLGLSILSSREFGREHGIDPWRERGALVADMKKRATYLPGVLLFTC